MTDENIIKALECCKKAKLNQDCLDLKCPFSTEYGCDIGLENLRNEALALINRQKAEIERLKNAYKQCAWERDTFLEELNTAKSEAMVGTPNKPVLFGEEHRFCNLLGNTLVFSKSLKDYNDMRKGLKAEGIKEFWDKAKQTREFRTCPYVYIMDGDDLVKEMVGTKADTSVSLIDGHIESDKASRKAFWEDTN